MKKSLKFRTMAGILAWIIALGTVPPVVSSANEIEEDPPAEVIESVAADYLGEVDDETEPEGTELDVTEPEKEDSEDNSEEASGEGASEDNSENTSGEDAPEDNSEETSGEGGSEDNSEETSGEDASEDNSENTSGEGAPEDNSEETSGEGASEDNSENTSVEDAPEDNSEGTSEEEPQPEESSLYEQLLVSETLTEMYDLLTAEENAETLLQLTEEEIAELLVKADGLYEMVEPYGEEFALYEEIVDKLNELPNAPESVTEENPEEENSEEDSEELGTAQEIMAEFAAAVELFPDEADFILYDEENNVVTRDDEAYYRAYAAFYEENPDIWATTDALYNEASEAFDAENPEGDFDAWMQDNGFWEAVEKFCRIPAPETVAEMIAQYEEDEEVETENTVEEEAPVIDPGMNALYEYRFKMYAYDENVYAQDAVVEPYATDGIMPEAFLNVYVEWTTLTVEEIDALDVTVVELYDETYEQMVEYALERYGEEELYKLRAYEVNFLLNGEPVEMTANPMTMEVELLNYERESMTFARVEEQEPAPEAEVGTILSTLTLDETGAPMEVGSVFVEEGAEEETATLMSFTATSSNVVVYANSTTANPVFTVQYYANIEVVADTGTKSLNIIDTTEKNLPKNGGDYTAGLLYLNDTNEQNSNLNNYKTLATKKEQTEVYKSQSYEYIYAPNLSYFNRLYENDNYNIIEVNVSTDGGENFVSYLPESVHFTNRKETADEDTSKNTVFLDSSKDNIVIRLVYNATEAEYNNTVSFYDYDISSGVYYTNQACTNEVSSDLYGSYDDTDKIFLDTGEEGINHNDNYVIGNGTVKLAFGNENCGTGLGSNQILVSNGDNLINGYNRNNKFIPASNTSGTWNNGCTFELTTGLNADGTLIYHDDIIAAPLFNEENVGVKGKTIYNDNYELTFDRTGDTYTLSAVYNTVTKNNVLSNLDVFGNPASYTHIWTNNFWPMDGVRSHGTKGHDVIFGSNVTQDLRNHKDTPTTYVGGTDDKTLPVSDDGVHHNSFFGMHFKVDFELTPDYIGPLEYYFFGDDDMWVYLSVKGKEADAELICDIGGVHSAVGEYVNLWDYIDKYNRTDDVTYTLHFFYTERGASGSTCFMRFTLPSVSCEEPQRGVGVLKIEKDVQSPFNTNTDQDVTFNIHFTDESGNSLKDDYCYEKYSADDELIGKNILIHDGDVFTLKDGQYIIVRYLPLGTNYRIEEVTQWEGFTTSIERTSPKDNEKGEIVGVTTETISGNIITGQIITESLSQYESVLFINKHNVVIDTAVHLDYLPYIILFAIVGTGVIIAASDKRREADE